MATCLLTHKTRLKDVILSADSYDFCSEMLQIPIRGAGLVEAGYCLPGACQSQAGLHPACQAISSLLATTFESESVVTLVTNIGLGL